MYPSKQIVSCFYCEWVGRKDKAQEHWKKKHPDEKFKLKISENNLIKYSFTKETTEQTRTSTNDDYDPDICEEQQQTNAVILSPSIPISTASTITILTSPSISASGPPSTSSTPSNISIPSSPNKSFRSPNSIQDQLTLVTKQLSKITDAIENIHLEKSSKESSSSSVIQAGNMDLLIDSIKCSDDFFMMKIFDINSQLDTITCIPCSSYKKQAPKHLLFSIKSSFGMFQYVEQKVDEPLSERFRNLKKHLKVHFLNKLHIWCVQEQEEKRRTFEDFVKRNEKAGLNVGRAALFSIRSGLGGLKFVETLNLLDLSGAAIGTYR
jgi:ferritin